MKLIKSVGMLLLLIACKNNRTQLPGDSIAKGKTMEPFEYNLQNAHPKAQEWMREDFYWSPIEETGPFGSDDGSDAAWGFHTWRAIHKYDNPVVYLQDLITGWNYPQFDWKELDPEKIEKIIQPTKAIDEMQVQLQIQQFREMAKNSPDSTMKNIDDSLLRESIIASMQQMDGSFLLGQDNAIIATGFAQFVLEGKVDEEMKMLTVTAIKRQLLPVLIDRYEQPYRETRQTQLTKMLDVMNKVSS